MVRPTTEIVYPADRRPACTVRVDSRWFVGEIALWRLRESGWCAVVCYFVTPETAYMRTVPAEDVVRLAAGDGEASGPAVAEVPTRAAATSVVTPVATAPGRVRDA
ncbi:hypothetical protein GCM10027596_28820 [Nocardioides korecus]